MGKGLLRLLALRIEALKVARLHRDALVDGLELCADLLGLLLNLVKLYGVGEWENGELRFVDKQRE